MSPQKYNGGLLCMKGNIYPVGKCPECGSKFIHVEPRGVWCPNHPQIEPRQLILRFGREISKKFTNYDQAYRFLTGLRYETEQGKFDPRDYRSSNPLGFSNIIDQYLADRRQETKKAATIKKYEQRLCWAKQFFIQRNVKHIQNKDLRQFIFFLENENKSSKYIGDILNCVRMVYNWLILNKDIQSDQIPVFPDYKPKMAKRKIVTKHDQQSILDQIHKDTWNDNPKIYIGILFLTTYLNVRPNELLQIKYENIDLNFGIIRIPGAYTKEREEKEIYLLNEDIELIKAIGPVFPKNYFFTHTEKTAHSPAKPGDRFGKDFFYNVWKRACKKIGVYGVSLYPGTRHSSAVDLRENDNSADDIKRGTGHSTNKAFERYLQVSGSELRKLYAQTRKNNVVPISKKVQPGYNQNDD